MTRIVPSVTRPWRERISRRHDPPPAGGPLGYREYRPCLRWEFGFTCAFCLVHETDLLLAVEGWAVMQIEHFVPKTRDPELINEYGNCFYICRLCNTARGNAPNRNDEGRELLNPCDSAWREHFEILDDELRSRDGAGADADFTSELYDFGDRRKVRLRRLRREVIEERVAFLRETRDLEDELLDDVEAAGGGPGMVKHVDTAKAIARARRIAFEDLLRFVALPRDRSDSCPCTKDRPPGLPPVLEEQTIELSGLRKGSRSLPPLS